MSGLGTEWSSSGDAIKPSKIHAKKRIKRKKKKPRGKASDEIISGLGTSLSSLKDSLEMSKNINEKRDGVWAKANNLS